MKYLRENNVVHRDVKPGNILLTKSPTGKYVLLSSVFYCVFMKEAFQKLVAIGNVTVWGTISFAPPTGSVSGAT